MKPSPKRGSGRQPDHQPHYVTGRDRKLIIERLREIDQMSAKELELLKSDSERLANHFRRKRPPKAP